VGRIGQGIALSFFFTRLILIEFIQYWDSMILWCIKDTYLHQPALGQVHESICKGAHPEAECLGTFLCLLPCLISAAARSNIIEYYVVDIMLYPVEFCGNRRHDGFSNRGSRGCEDSQRWRRPHERIFIVLWLGVLFVKISLFWFFVIRIFDTVFTESHFRPV